MVRPTLSFVGAGTLGTAVALACSSAGYQVVAVHSRTAAHARRLAEALPHAKAVQDTSDVTRADLTFLTVPDDAIAEVCQSISWSSASSVVHCSGALSLQALDTAANTGAAVGSFHPLQTFAGANEGPARFHGIACALEASTDALHATLEELTVALGSRPQWIRGEAKPLYHASAAMASNYLVTLLGDASRLWESFGYSRDHGLDSLLPLVRGTIDNLQDIGFPDALTGPIARGDIDTVRIHLDVLAKSFPDIIEAYVTMGKRTIALGVEKGSLAEEAAREIQELLDSAARTKDEP